MTEMLTNMSLYNTKVSQLVECVEKFENFIIRKFNIFFVFVVKFYLKKKQRILSKNLNLPFNLKMNYLYTDKN